MNKKISVLMMLCVLFSGCIDEETSLEDLSSAPKAASFSIDMDEDDENVFQLSVTDRENNVTEYFLEEAPSHGVISGDYPNLLYKPTSNYFGKDQFKYKVTDGSYDSNIATVSITIKPINDSPLIGGSPSNNLIAYDEYLFSPKVSDVEGDSLVFSINIIPGWATFNESNGQISGVPTNSDVGVIEDIVISVSDNLTTANLASFSLTILANPWAPKEEMPSPSRGYASAVYNDLIYFFESSGSDGNKNVLVYDPSEDKWITKSEMPINAWYSTAHTIGNKIYFVAGYNYSGLRNEFFEYDPLLDSWSTRASKPTSRLGFASASLNGKIYVIGGSGESMVEIYDPSSDSWSVGASSPVAFKVYPTACVLNSKIYVLGGEYVSNVLVYDPFEDSWAAAENMNISRSLFSCNSLNNKLYVFGGRSSVTSTLSSAEVYSPESGIWSTLPQMRTDRYNHASERVNGKIYVLGGNKTSSGIPMPDVEELDPSLIP